MTTLQSCQKLSDYSLLKNALLKCVHDYIVTVVSFFFKLNLSRFMCVCVCVCFTPTFIRAWNFCKKYLKKCFRRIAVRETGLIRHRVGPIEGPIWSLWNITALWYSGVWTGCLNWKPQYFREAWGKIWKVAVLQLIMLPWLWHDAGMSYGVPCCCSLSCCCCLSCSDGLCCSIFGNALLSVAFFLFFVLLFNSWFKTTWKTTWQNTVLPYFVRLFFLVLLFFSCSAMLLSLFVLLCFFLARHWFFYGRFVFLCLLLYSFLPIYTYFFIIHYLVLCFCCCQNIDFRLAFFVYRVFLPFLFSCLWLFLVWLCFIGKASSIVWNMQEKLGHFARLKTHDSRTRYPIPAKVQWACATCGDSWQVAAGQRWHATRCKDFPKMAVACNGSGGMQW